MCNDNNDDDGDGNGIDADDDNVEKERKKNSLSKGAKKKNDRNGMEKPLPSTVDGIGKHGERE